MTTVASQLFGKTCRTCLSTDGEMVRIFSSEPHVKNLPIKIMTFTKVEIAEDDGLPDIICKKCVFLAESFYCFKEQCESADSRLKSMVVEKVRERCSLQRRKKIGSDSNHRTSKTAISVTTRSSPREDTSAGSRASEIIGDDSASKDIQDSEDEYIVEYISDDVRIEVENALKRKREAERRVSIEKVSESIKNLKGIEVVPISGKTAQSFRSNEMKTEEIVVFPVGQTRRMDSTSKTESDVLGQKSFLNPQMIDIEYLEEFLEQRKRLKLSSESTREADPEKLLKTETLLNHGSNKKLHFSTVRKVVKIDDEALFVNPKDKIIEHPKEECFQIENQLHQIIEIDGDMEPNDEDFKVILQHEKEPWISDLQEGSEEYKMQSDPKDIEELEEVQESKNILEFRGGDRRLVNPMKSIQPQQQTIRDQKEYENSNDVIVVESEGETGKEKFYFHPDMAVDDVEVLEQEFQQIQNSGIPERLPSHSFSSESTVGCIIKSCNEPNVNENNAEGIDDAIANLETVENIVESCAMRADDKSNEVFVENEFPEGADDNSIRNDESSTVNPSNFSASNDLEFAKCQDKTKKNVPTTVSIIDLQAENKVTPLALVKVNLSDEKDQKPSLNIYQRDTITDEVQEDFAAKAESLISSGERNSDHSLKFYQCTVCKANFATMPAVLKHNIQKHMPDEMPFPCLICDKIFEDKPLLIIHVEEHNGLRPYKCTFCPKTFTLKRNLKRHVNHHISYKPFQCSVCMKRFTESSSLKSHMYLHTGDSPFACKLCNVSFNNKANWRRHIMTIHEKLTVVYCKHCNKEVPDKRSLQIHMRTHTGDRPYQCPHCEKRFTQQCNLNTHIHCHLNDRPFLCSYCGKGFNQRGTRDDHILTHTGEKRHKCSECSATFTVSSALKRHMWMHTDRDRPYSCKKCNMQFVGLYDLRRHLKVRHGEIVRPGNPRVERVTMIKPVKEEEYNRNVSEENAESLENVAKTESSSDRVVEEKESEESSVPPVIVMESETIEDEEMSEKQES